MRLYHSVHRHKLTGWNKKNSQFLESFQTKFKYNLFDVISYVTL